MLFSIKRFFLAALLTAIISVVIVLISGLVHLKAVSNIDSRNLGIFLGFEGSQDSILEIMGDEIWILIVTSVTMFFLVYIFMYWATPRFVRVG